MSLERYLYKKQVEISFIGLILGIIMFVLGLLDVVLRTYMDEELLGFLEPLGNWTYWFLVGTL